MGVMNRLLEWLGGLRSVLGRGSPSGGTGAWGESRAARYLNKKKGMRVLVLNWRNGREEIDLVCEDRGVLVFVEVKTRSGPPGSGYYAVDRRKKAALRRASRAYLAQLPRRPPHFRFDIVEAIVGSGRQMELHHYENVSLR